MGNINTLETQTQNNKQKKGFLQKVQKVSSDYSQKWGNYSIYQQQQKPYDYFLQYIHVSLAQRDFLQKRLNFYQNMPKHKNLVPVQYAQIVKRKQMCAQFDVLRAFCMYYNFTLEDAIKVKLKQRSNFSEGQLVYILRSLLLIGNYYESELKAKCYSGIFQCRDIFISPQGHLKIYPFNDNIFISFVDIINRKQEKIEDKKEERKDFFRKGSFGKKLGIEPERNSTKRAEQRKGGLRTTLRDESLKEANSVKQLNGINGSQTLQSQSYFMRHQSQSSYLNLSRQSDGSFSINQRIKEYQFLDMRKNDNGQDWFELGLLMMQLILLNESRQYYIQRQSAQLQKNFYYSSGFSKDKLVGNQQRTNEYDRVNKRNYHNLCTNPSYLNTGFITNNQSNSHYYQEYINNEGKIPNLDLIYFSLHNSLPKKNISSVLIEIISLLLTNKNKNLTYQQLINTLQQHQQTLTQPKYCLKFDVSKHQESFTPQSTDKQFSRYIVKNHSLDPLLKTTNLSSNAFMNNESSFNSVINQNKILSQSKESFFARNLDDLVNANNLTKSMVVQGQDNNNNSMIVLDNLKKSRKLVPSKIRSISNKNVDLPEIKSKKESQNFQLTFG